MNTQLADVRLITAAATKTELVAYLVADHDDPRGGWDRFYRSWTMDNLRAQILKRAARKAAQS